MGYIDIFFLSALYGSDLCVCGQNISILNQQNDTLCDKDCIVLNPTAKCGGRDSMAVYRAGNSRGQKVEGKMLIKGSYFFIRNVL